jgi:hypothetical protein
MKHNNWCMLWQYMVVSYGVPRGTCTWGENLILAFLATCVGCSLLLHLPCPD